MDIGNAIKEARKLKGVSQKELIEKLEISQTHMSLVENNQVETSLKLIKSVSSALNIPVALIFFYSISENDVAPEKRGVFNMMKPMLDSIVGWFFNINK